MDPFGFGSLEVVNKATSGFEIYLSPQVLLLVTVVNQRDPFVWLTSGIIETFRVRWCLGCESTNRNSHRYPDGSMAPKKNKNTSFWLPWRADVQHNSNTKKETGREKKHRPVKVGPTLVKKQNKTTCDNRSHKTKSGGNLFLGPMCLLVTVVKR